jgi:hypothetical protein
MQAPLEAACHSYRPLRRPIRQRLGRSHSLTRARVRSILTNAGFDTVMRCGRPRPAPDLNHARDYAHEAQRTREPASFGPALRRRQHRLRVPARKTAWPVKKQNIVLPITTNSVKENKVASSSVGMAGTKGGHNAGGNLHSARRNFSPSLSGNDTGEQITVHSF